MIFFSDSEQKDNAPKPGKKLFLYLRLLEFFPNQRFKLIG
jgi:hypothetical protein